MKAAIGEPLVLEAIHGSQAPEPEADEAAGVATVDHWPQAEEEVASGVEELAPVHGSHEPPVEAAGVLTVEDEPAPVHGSHEPEAASGVDEVEHEVEVLVHNGTEMVHGQSVTVRVVEAVMV